ncbi:hypothetical protein HID58_039623, partial [Brassica napus]
AAKKKDRTSNGALMISKDPENLRDIAFREYKILVKEENEVNEEVLVRDVLYACQGIDGKFVKFNSEINGYAVVDYINTPRATKVMIRTLSELGWLFKKVKTFVSESMVDRLETVGQAFCAALQYEARAPLDTVFTDSALSKYLRVFNFLWKLKRVEHALIGIWKTMKPNSFVNLQSSVKLQLLSALRRCQVLWNEMNHFVTNFQYYIMFEVLEVSWCNFSKEMEAAKDLDDLLAAHEKYLSSIVGKSLLGEQSQTIRKSLFVLFELILRFRSHADRLYEGIYELQIRTKESGRERTKTQESSSWISEGRKAITQRAGEFLQSMSRDMDSIAKEYTTSLDAFLSLLPLQQTVDLKFLFFRLDFTEFYSRLHFKRKES